MKDVALSKINFTEDLKKLSCSGFLERFYNSAIINKLPVVLWRLPGKNEKFGMVDFSGSVSSIKLNFSDNQKGFAFSPFRNDSGNSTLFIKSHLHADCSQKIFIETKNPYNEPETFNRTKFTETFNRLVEDVNYKVNYSESFYESDKTDASVIYSEEDFCNLVKQAVRQIKGRNVRKIVLSRITEAELKKDFEVVQFFEKLAEKYSAAFVSVISIPGVGTWIGATPETLLRISENELRTEALAGTQAIKPETDLFQIKWNEKEKEEQILVVDYIRGAFYDSKQFNFFQEEPKTIRAGNVAHLKTRFNLVMESRELKEFASNFLGILHPTPAVCGLPKKEALSFILEHETHNRDFYSGYLGPVNIFDESHLFVNLRCMKLKDKNAVLYVGCGITEGSIPESEWEETGLKADTLLSVINDNGKI